MKLKVHDIVEFWSSQERDAYSGHWRHPRDQEGLAGKHTLNLEFPISPYVGKIETAPIIILGANAGYDESLTPSEFADEATISAYVDRVRYPEPADWSVVSRYYDKVNYGEWIVDGRAAILNASPYRSPKLSCENEADNRAIIKSLPSTIFNKRWLREVVFPLAEGGKRLVIAHRWIPWGLKSKQQISGLIFDLKNRAFPNIHSDLMSRARAFLEGV